MTVSNVFLKFLVISMTDYDSYIVYTISVVTLLILRSGTILFASFWILNIFQCVNNQLLICFAHFLYQIQVNLCFLISLPYSVDLLKFCFFFSCCIYFLFFVNFLTCLYNFPGPSIGNLAFHWAQVYKIATYNLNLTQYQYLLLLLLALPNPAVLISFLEGKAIQQIQPQIQNQ